MKRAAVVVTFVVLALGRSAGSSIGATWRVDPAGTGDATTIQAGIDLAAEGDIVLVAPAVYSGSGNEGLVFGGKTISLVGEAGLAGTILRPLGGRIMQSDGGSPTIQGFTFEAAQAPPGEMGGALLVSGGAPSIVACRFSQNAAATGAAIACVAGSPGIRDCVFDGNGAGVGAAVYSTDASPIIEGCLFHNNSAASGIVTFDRGLQPIIRSCTFVDNASSTGTIDVTDSAPVIENTILSFDFSGHAVHCGPGAQPDLQCCITFSNWLGNDICGLLVAGNLIRDPLFCRDSGAEPYALRPGSPGLPENNECGVVIGAIPTLCVTTPIRDASWSVLKALYRSE